LTQYTTLAHVTVLSASKNHNEKPHGEQKNIEIEKSGAREYSLMKTTKIGN